MWRRARRPHFGMMSPLDTFACLHCNLLTEIKTDRQFHYLAAPRRYPDRPVDLSTVWTLKFFSHKSLCLSSPPCQGMSNSPVRKSFNLDPRQSDDQQTHTVPPCNGELMHVSWYVVVSEILVSGGTPK